MHLQKLREEVRGYRRPDGWERRALDYDDLGKLELTDMAFKALRMVPPVLSMPRRALKDFEFGGYRIPAGQSVGITIHWTHHSRNIGTIPTPSIRCASPDSKGAAQPRLSSARICPACILPMQVKVLMTLLQRYRIEAQPDTIPRQDWLIPKDGLKVEFGA